LGELVNLALSKGAVKSLPPVTSTVLFEVAKVCTELDSDLCLDGLYIEGQINKRPEYYGGIAYPSTLTKTRKQTVFHPDGKIVLNFSRSNNFEEVVRLFAHELRHIGQFHRGRETHDYMTIQPLTSNESEEDAYWFETQVWKTWRS
jgi:hypothetical protein